ncbi:MAG TPA: hypothetical protein VHF69_05750, partial [Candidatus Synoicihabitans sp.]|nr:hypothetical protein [Candidatus Synoicihabitans sp.]
MKNLRLFTLSLLLPARAAFAQVDVTSTVTEALANTLDGDNYRWTSQLTLPLGEQLSVTGESAGNLKRITTVGPRGTETVFVVGRQAFRQAEAGWEVLPTRNREDRVRALQDQPPAGDPTQPKRGTPDRLIMRGGFPPHTGIEFAL